MTQHKVKIAVMNIHAYFEIVKLTFFDQ